MRTKHYFASSRGEVYFICEKGFRSHGGEKNEFDVLEVFLSD